MSEPAPRGATTGESVAREIVAQTPWIQRLARSLVRDPSLADDVVQETLLAALRHGNPDRHFPRSWYAAVVRNYVRFWHRGDQRRGAREVDHARWRGGVHERAPSAELELRELRDRVVDEVERLEEPYRSTVRLRYLEERSVAEVAEVLEVAESTVRVRLARVHRQLLTRFATAEAADDRGVPRFLAGLCLFAGAEPHAVVAPSVRTVRPAAGRGAWVAAGAAAVVLVFILTGVGRDEKPLAVARVDVGRGGESQAELGDGGGSLDGARERRASADVELREAEASVARVHEREEGLAPATEAALGETVIRVLGPREVPIEGAEVFLEPSRAAIESGLSATLFLLAAPRDEDRVGVTDARGELRVRGRALDSSNLRVLASGYRGHFEVARHRSATGVHAVRLDDPPVTDLRLTFPGGRPVVDLPVTVLGSGGGERSLVTDSRGGARFQWDAWAHVVEFEEPGYASIQVAAAAPNMAIELHAGEPLEGRVVDELGAPVVGCRVEVLSNLWEGHPAVAVTNEMGEFRSIAVTDPARLRLTLRHPDLGVDRMTRSYHRSDGPMLLEFRRGTWIEGEVLADAAAAPREVTVYAYPRGRSYFTSEVRSATWDDQRRFALRVRPGKYWLRVTSPGMATTELEVVADGERVALDPVRLTPSKPIHGVVRDAAGHPVEGARLRFGTVRGDRIVGAEVVSDDGGRFVLTGQTRDPRPMDPARRDTRWWFLGASGGCPDFAIEVAPPFVFREVNGVAAPTLRAYGPVHTHGVAACEFLEVVVDRDRAEAMALDLRTPDDTTITSSASVIFMTDRWMQRVFAGMRRELDEVRNVAALDGGLAVVKSDYTAWGFQRLRGSESLLRVVLHPWTVRTFHVRDSEKQPIAGFGLYLAPVVDGYVPRAALSIGRTGEGGQIYSHDIGPGIYDVYRDDGTDFDVCARPVKDLSHVTRLTLGADSEVWITSEANVAELTTYSDSR